VRLDAVNKRTCFFHGGHRIRRIRSSGFLFSFRGFGRSSDSSEGNLKFSGSPQDVFLMSGFDLAWSVLFPFLVGGIVLRVSLCIYLVDLVSAEFLESPVDHSHRCRFLSVRCVRNPLDSSVMEIHGQSTTCVAQRLERLRAKVTSSEFAVAAGLSPCGPSCLWVIAERSCFIITTAHLGVVRRNFFVVLPFCSFRDWPGLWPSCLSWLDHCFFVVGKKRRGGVVWNCSECSLQLLSPTEDAFLSLKKSTARLSSVRP
jgi:hypothetical protein